MSVYKDAIGEDMEFKTEIEKEPVAIKRMIRIVRRDIQLEFLRDALHDVNALQTAIEKTSAQSAAAIEALNLENADLLKQLHVELEKNHCTK